MAPPPPNLARQTFKINQRVLVPYTDKYYEAKVKIMSMDDWRAKGRKRQQRCLSLDLDSKTQQHKKKKKQILKVRRKEPGTYDLEKKHESAYEYLVHYPGWNKDWDDWVSQEAMLKFSEELSGAPVHGGGGGGGKVTSAAASAATAAASTAGAGKAASSRGDSPAKGGSGQQKPPLSAAAPFNPAAARGSTPQLRSLAGSLPAPPAAVAAARAVAAAAEAEAEAAARRRKKKRSADDVALAPAKRVNAPLPPALAAALVDDHDRLMSGIAPSRLPITPCVDQVLAAYARDSRAERERAAGAKRRRRRRKGREGAAAGAGIPAASPVPFEDDLADSLRDYFDKVVLKMLLYPCERAEAEAATATGLSPGALLGGRHLLRLLVMLPALLPPGPKPVERAFGGGGGAAAGAGPESATVPVDVQLRHFMRWLAKGADTYLRAPPAGDKAEEEAGEEEEEGAGIGKGKSPSPAPAKGKAAAAPASGAAAVPTEGDKEEPAAKKAKVAE